MLKRIFIPLLITPFFFLFYNCEQQKDITFSGFDKNDNNYITLDEFQEAFANHYYSRWNPENKETVEEDDLLRATYRMWDTDKNQNLDEEEYTIGFDHDYGNYILDDFENIDENHDGYIGYNEYSVALQETSFFLDWDIHKDNTINEEDIASRVFSRWDIDQSGLLEIDEFNEFKEYYLKV